MAVINDILADRATSGARYAAAITELRAAWVELSSIEYALANGNVGRPVPTFRGDFNQIPHELRHPEFAPNPLTDPADDAKAAARLVIDSINGVPRED